MTAAKNRKYYQTYLRKLRDKDAEGENSIELVEADTSNLDPNDGGDLKKNTGRKETVIIDADGNYYYQTSEEMVTDKTTATEISGAPLAKRKNEDRKDPESSNTSKLEVTKSKTTKYVENDLKNADATITSEIGNQEKVYEFDENEQDPGNSQVISNQASESLLVIKNAKKDSANDPALFLCMVCSYETNKRFLLSRHLKTHCDERPHICTVCERGFKTKSALNNHRNTHLGHKPYGCSSCEKAFTTSGELIRHVRYRHTHIKPHKCTECDYSSVEMSKMRRHMRCHTGERPYQCPHCTYASPDTFKLKRHMRIHTGEKPYECDICHARFTQGNSLKHHRFIHSVNEKPVFQCHLCPTTCGRKTDLRLHIQNLHTSDNPIPCKRCGKELPDRYSYKMHMKTHEGEKCFRCDYCPYAAISQRHLDSHVFIHLDVKPFVCDTCHTSFRQKQLLNRHMKIYHSVNYEAPVPRLKNHKCPHCNRMFAHNGNLIRHMEVHDTTSRRYEEKLKLRIGRMRRVKSDGTIVTEAPNSGTRIFNDEEFSYEEPAEEQEHEQVEDEEIPECEETEEYNEENMQYLYDEYDEADEYEEPHEEQQYEEYRTNKETLLIDVKQEKMQEINVSDSSVKKSITLKVEDEKDSEILFLEQNEDQDFMVIEVLTADEGDDEVQPVQTQDIKPTIINKTANKSCVKKSHKNSQSLLSDYFGFEVNAGEDDEETKGVIEILKMIEQE